MHRVLRRKEAQRVARALAVAAACLGLPACASRPTPHPVAGNPAALAANAATPTTEPAPAPAAPTLESIAGTILPGFDLGSSRDDWQIGDRVLVGLRSVKPDSITERLVLVELTADLDAKSQTTYSSTSRKGRTYTFASPIARTQITLFDASGAKIAEASGRFPVKLLGYGPYDGAEPVIGHPEAADTDDGLPDVSDADYDRMMRGWGALFTFSGSLGKRGLFKSMLEDVLVKPSLLRMLFHPTAALTFGDKQWPAYQPNWSPPTSSVPSVELRTIRIPLELRIADRPALAGELLAAEPVAPLSLCGGLLRATGHRPDDDSVRIELTLLGAARGHGGKTFTAAKPDRSE